MHAVEVEHTADSVCLAAVVCSVKTVCFAEAGNFAEVVAYGVVWFDNTAEDIFELAQ